jgi:hypothetical protein
MRDPSNGIRKSSLLVATMYKMRGAACSLAPRGGKARNYRRGVDGGGPTAEDID